ncbi:MAG: beta-lactamase class C family [Verrucomicrobia bacterium]|nr:MAG: beta-lactamase class C family [Verrucomicrobiota bacterium]
MKSYPLFCAFLVFALPLAPTSVRADLVSSKMGEFVEKGVVSGAVTLVANKKGIEHWEAVGKSDLASGREMQKTDLFWIASMTKPMTALCVLMLQERGLLSVEDPVEKYLPEFKGQWLLEHKEKDRLSLVRPSRAVTLRDLLTHTSGLGDVKPPRPSSSLAELAMGYAHEPLQFEPGSKWSYSNPGINTLGRIVEVVSGEKFSSFIQGNLFDPIGMKDTTFWPTKEQAKRLAKSYNANKETGKLEETSIYFIQGNLSGRQRTAFPAGGLFSTTGDVARLYRMLLNGGELKGKRLLQPETVALMTSTQSGEIKTGFVDGMSWGLGFQVVKEPQGVTAGLSQGSFGHGGAYATQSWGDPKVGRVYIMLIQRAGLGNSDASEIRGEFHNAAAQLPAKAAR